MENVLIAGCGYVGTALGLHLAAAGHAVWGLRRDASRLPEEIRPWQADLGAPASLHPLPAAFDFVYYTAGASNFTEAAYRAAYVEGPRRLLDALAEQPSPPRRVFFTSSTGVYHQNNGEWIDECSPAEPVRFSGRCLLEGEAVFAGAPFPATTLRLGGIYGPGRTRLLDNVRGGTAQCVEGSAVCLNLIHRDDCAGALAHLMSVPAPAGCYLGVDDEPVERNALLRWLAARLGLPEPAVVPAGEGFEPQRGGNRRCSNARLKSSGYRFQCPTYRDGYAGLL